MTTLKDLGEDALIERLKELFSESHNDAATGVILSIGDDAAVTEPTPGRHIVSSTDILIEGIHFSKDWSPPYLLGRKAVSTSVSDIAAMGGEARHLLLSIALPGETEISFIEELYRGIMDEAARYSVSVVGGNTSASPGPTIISTTVMGEVDDGRAVKRSGASVGEIIYVTGTLGSSALGLRLLQAGGATPSEPHNENPYDDGPYASALMRHLAPQARLDAGLALSRSGAATSMMDLSDGLQTDLPRLTSASGVGAVIQSALLPVSAELREWAEKNPGGESAAGLTSAELTVMKLAIGGGEDYELLFTAPEGAVTTEVAEEAGVPITAIGEVVEAAKGVAFLGEDGKALPRVESAFSHFHTSLDD